MSWEPLKPTAGAKAPISTAPLHKIDAAEVFLLHWWTKHTTFSSAGREKVRSQNSRSSGSKKIYKLLFCASNTSWKKEYTLILVWSAEGALELQVPQDRNQCWFCVLSKHLHGIPNH